MPTEPVHFLGAPLPPALRLAALVVALALGPASPAVAAAAGAELVVQLPLLAYDHASQTTKPETGDSVDTTTGEVTTVPLADAALSFYWNKLALHANPFSDTRQLSAGFFVMPPLEVGGLFGYNSRSVDKPETSASTTTIGAYAVYTARIKKLAIEGGGNLHYAAAAGETTTKVGDTATTTKTKTSGFGFALEGLLLVPLKKNLFYGAGLGLAYDTAKESESKTERSGSTISLNLATVRATFD